jgi:hypothetical protein
MIEDAVREAIQRRDGASHLALEPALARDIVGRSAGQCGSTPTTPWW